MGAEQVHDFAFYNAGCVEPKGLRRGVVLVRRILRRILRPILYRQAELLGSVSREIAKTAAKQSEDHANMLRTLEAHSTRQDFLDRQTETAIAMGWEMQEMAQRIATLEAQIQTFSSRPNEATTSSAPWVLHAAHQERGQRPHQPAWSVGPSKMRRMRVLALVASSNQIYSGIGRNIRELGKRLGDKVELEFATDDLFPRNTDLLAKFARENHSKLHIGHGYYVPESMDPVNDSLPGLLAEGRWDAIELIGWANATTNRMGLEGAGDALIFYTPHYQPTWTVPMSATRALSCETIHHQLIQRADAVFCVSGWERATLQATNPHRNHCKFPTQGCDFAEFMPGLTQRRPSLLFVGDQREFRKRFDRVITTFERLLVRRPELRLTVIGNGSDELSASLPEHVRKACDLRGYVTEAELKQAYAESRGLFLLSEYEAFGLPVIEAMACGTPVFLTCQESTWSLFHRYKGENFCPADDLEATTAIIEANLDRGDEAVAEVLGERDALRSAFDWGPLAQNKWRTMSACWYQKTRQVAEVSSLYS